MLYTIGVSPVNVLQPVGNAGLIVNQGPDTVYLDTHSAVSNTAYSLKCTTGQSVNWAGGTLWAISDGTATLSYMQGLDTAISTIEGATVNIGNSVRPWGGGSRIGSVTASLNGIGYYQWKLGLLAPAINAGRYASIHVYARYTGTTAPCYDLIQLGTDAIVQAQHTMATDNTSTAQLGHGASAYVSCPIICDDPYDDMFLGIFHSHTVATQIVVDIYGTYEAGTLVDNNQPTSNQLVFPLETAPTRRYVLLNYRVPVKVFIVTGSSDRQNADVTLHHATVTDPGRILQQTIAATIPASTQVMSDIIYPNPTGVWFIGFWGNATNTGVARILVTQVSQ